MFLVFFTFVCSSPSSGQADNARPLTHMCRRSYVHFLLHHCVFVAGTYMSANLRSLCSCLCVFVASFSTSRQFKTADTYLSVVLRSLFFTFVCLSPLAEQAENARPLAHMCVRSCVHCVLHLCVSGAFI